MAGKP